MALVESVDGRRSGSTAAWCWRTARGQSLGAVVGPIHLGPAHGVTRTPAVEVVRLGQRRTSLFRSSRHALRGRLSREDGFAPQLVAAAPNRGTTWGRVTRKRVLGIDVNCTVAGARKRARVWAVHATSSGSAQALRPGIGRQVGARDNWSVAEIA